MKKSITLIAAIVLMAITSSMATHIVGGEFSVIWKSGNTFHVTLNFYRDCGSGNADFDDPVSIGLYDKVTNVNQQCFTFALSSRTILTLGDQCYRPSVCVERGVYEGDVVIPNNANGYYISYSRCCRNNIITNLLNPGATGEAWYAEIADPALHNSTPVFASYPKGYMCTNNINIENFSTTDADGDSLVYSLVAPLAGHTTSGVPVGTCPDPGPYPDVVYAAGYSVNNQVGGAPALTINPQTGFITAKPSVIGIFVISMKVEQYRRSDKKKLGEVRRDLQYSSLACTVAAAFPDTTICAGNPVQLHATGGTTYNWSPTTGLVNPTSANPVATVFTTTTYTVTVSSGGCASTATVTIHVNSNINVSITPNGPTTFCEGGSVLLSAIGGTSYKWNTGDTTTSISVNSTGTYSVVGTTSGCSGSATQNVTVNPNPKVTITPNGPTTFCQVGSVLLTASGAATYKWSNNSTNTSILATASGTYSVTGTTNGCTGTASIAVVANPKPQVTIAANGPITFCEPGSVTLTASGALTYKWNTGATTTAITVSVGQTYYAVGTDANGCSAISNFITVTVNRRPTVVITPNGPTSFCLGGSVQLCATGGTTYLWTGGATTSCINVTSQGQYTVTAKNTNECLGFKSIAVTTTPVPVVTITGAPLSFCPGDSVVLTAHGAAGYVWSPNGEITNSITVKTSGTFSVTGTTDGCSASAPPVTVTVNSALSVTITPDGPTSYCIGGSVGLCATQGASYIWSPGGETTQCITAVNEDNYSVTVTNSSGCVGSTALPVNVNPLPVVVVTPDGPTTFCEPLDVTLNVTGAANYVWSPGNETTNSIVVNKSGTFSAVGTDANGCSSVSNEITVQANPLPTVTAVPDGPTTFCQGGSVNIGGNGAASYVWNPTNETTTSIHVNTSGSFYTVGTDANGCTGTSNTVVVVVNPLPTPVITAGGKTTFCIGDSVTLSAAGADNFVWDPNSEITGSITVKASGTFFVVGTNVTGCSGTSNSIPVVVNPNPTVTIIPGGPTEICEGGSVQLCASNGTTFSWNLNGGTDQCFIAQNPGSYIVSITDANGCGAVSDPLTVTVGLPPDVIANVNGVLTCINHSVTLRANDCTGSGITYSWIGPGGFTATQQCAPAFAVGTYTVTADRGGCINTTTTEVFSNTTPPDVTATGGELTCGVTSVKLTSYTSLLEVEFGWTGPNGFTSAEQNPVVTDSGTYTVTVTDLANGCTATATAHVSKRPGQMTGVCGDQGSVNEGFELDGNATAVLPNVPDDWDLIYNGTSSADYVAFTTDAPSDEDDFFYQGTKDYQDITQWNSMANRVPDKDDLLHAGAALYGHMFYFFSDRFAVNGGAQMGLWLLQDDVKPQSGGTFSGSHHIGDLLILSDFTQGGKTPVMFAYEWVGSGGSDGALNKITLQQASAFAAVNSDPVPAPWPYTPKFGQPGILPPGAFFEGGIDLACLKGDGFEGCFPSFIMESRASAQVTAELKDYIYGSLVVNPNGHRMAQPKEEGKTLLRAYPNPFSSVSTIEFQRTGETARMLVEVYTLTGEKVATLFDKEAESGVLYKAEFDGSKLAEGIYIYKISGGDQVFNGKLVLMK